MRPSGKIGRPAALQSAQIQQKARQYRGSDALDSIRSAAKSSSAARSVCRPSAGTAHRLLEIARRNEIRQGAGLPLLSIPRELRLMKRQEELVAFGRFEIAHRRAVWDQVLASRRLAEVNPNWRPSWMEGIGYQSEVRRILWEQFRAAQTERLA